MLIICNEADEACKEVHCPCCRSIMFDHFYPRDTVGSVLRRARIALARGAGWHIVCRKGFMDKNATLILYKED